MIEKEFKKEIFVMVKQGEPKIFQYNDESLFNLMLSRFRKWESEGKLDIIEVRQAQYII